MTPRNGLSLIEKKGWLPKVLLILRRVGVVGRACGGGERGDCAQGDTRLAEQDTCDGTFSLNKGTEKGGPNACKALQVEWGGTHLF
jgi:hypothetical protein